MSTDIKKLDGLMQEYYLAVYQHFFASSRGVAEKNNPVPMPRITELRAQLIDAVGDSGLNGTMMTNNSTIGSHLYQDALHRAWNETGASLTAQMDVAGATKQYLKYSPSVIAMIDNKDESIYNPRTLRVEISNRDQLAISRGQKVDLPKTPFDAAPNLKKALDAVIPDTTDTDRNAVANILQREVIGHYSNAADAITHLKQKAAEFNPRTAEVISQRRYVEAAAVYENMDRLNHGRTDLIRPKPPAPQKESGVLGADDFKKADASLHAYYEEAFRQQFKRSKGIAVSPEEGGRIRDLYDQAFTDLNHVNQKDWILPTATNAALHDVVEAARAAATRAAQGGKDINAAVVASRSDNDAAARKAIVSVDDGNVASNGRAGSTHYVSHDALVTQARGGQAAPAPAPKTAPKPPATAKTTDITAFQGDAYKIAYEEAKGAGFENVDPAVRKEMNRILREDWKIDSSIKDEDTYNRTVKAAQKEIRDHTYAGNDKTKQAAYEWALGVYSRAHYIYQEQMAGHSQVRGFANGKEMEHYYFNPNSLAKQAAQGAGGNQGSDLVAGGDDHAVDGGNVPCPPGQTTQRKAKGGAGGSVGTGNGGKSAPIDKQTQFELEMLGLSTGQKTPFDFSDVGTLDGVIGGTTRKSITKFLADHPELKGDRTITLSPITASPLVQAIHDASEAAIAKFIEAHPDQKDKPRDAAFFTAVRDSITGGQPAATKAKETQSVEQTGAGQKAPDGPPSFTDFPKPDEVYVRTPLEKAIDEARAHLGVAGKSGFLKDGITADERALVNLDISAITEAAGGKLEGEAARAVKELTTAIKPTEASVGTAPVGSGVKLPNRRDDTLRP
jgi:hypothetical protein